MGKIIFLPKREPVVPAGNISPAQGTDVIALDLEGDRKPQPIQTRIPVGDRRGRTCSRKDCYRPAIFSYGYEDDEPAYFSCGEKRCVHFGFLEAKKTFVHRIPVVVVEEQKVPIRIRTDVPQPKRGSIKYLAVRAILCFCIWLTDALINEAAK